MRRTTGWSRSTLPVLPALFTAMACTTPEAGRVDTPRADTGAVTAEPVKPPTFPARTAPRGEFRAVGNEPGWLLMLDDSLLTLRWDYDERRVTVAAPPAESLPDGRRHRFVHRDTLFIVSIQHVQCSDGMSGRQFPSRVQVSIGARTLDGCGGAPAELLQRGEWRVETLNGEPLVGDSRITLAFGKDGRLAGTASCNSYTAPYRVTWDALSIGPATSTRMACGAEIDRQETVFLQLIEKPLTFHLDENDLLHFSLDRTTVLTAARSGR
jgi:heat shock protein HslJ